MKKIWQLFSRYRGKGVLCVPIANQVVFPHNIVGTIISCERSIATAEKALNLGKELLLAFLKEGYTNEDSVDLEEYSTTGVFGKILQLTQISNTKYRLVVQGTTKAKIFSFYTQKEVFYARSTPNMVVYPLTRELILHQEVLRKVFLSYSKAKKISQEVVKVLEMENHPEKELSIIMQHCQLTQSQRINFLESTDINRVMEEVTAILEMEKDMNYLRQDINQRIRRKMERTQKEFYLNEQLKEIRKELGQTQSDNNEEKDQLEADLEKKDLPKEVRLKVNQELKRISKLPPLSPESGVLRTYLEWIADLPWGERTADNRSLKEAAQILDEDHFNMEKPKLRILEFIATRQLRGDSKGPILCLVGPPGTGKTSLGCSVAKALNRKSTRISLGGVRDEAEIRGHRKTYVGAFPGKIIQALKKVKSSNPVILLDEIDKMTNDFRGDPAAALLEVLDPEQNFSFVDHYLEVPVNLSEVLFITTANSIHTIPPPLLDRMEVIEIPGYADYEKVEIAKNFIIPKQLEQNGIENANISIPRQVLPQIIHFYTREAGVRNLEKQIAKIIRKIAKETLEEYQNSPGHYCRNSAFFHKFQELYARDEKLFQKLPSDTEIDVEITEEKLTYYLGLPTFTENRFQETSPPGMAVGLAWTGAGGSVLPVEAALLQGEGKLHLTGKLGDVMKESASIAISYLRSQAEKYDIEPYFSKEKDIHIHVPEGAIPKDGPSAGITMTVALLSAIKGVPTLNNTAMTGEITLSGRLLPVGGIKEKTLAAHRNGITRVLLPEKNSNDKDELPEEVRKDMEFVVSNTVDEALWSLFPEGTFSRQSSSV